MKQIWILVAILILAAFLRLYRLDTNPPAAYGDEISFAWNAWNILKTGTDQYGTSYPLQFRAFDDYKAPIPVYLLVPFLKVFGLSAFVVRLPVVLFAIGTIYVTFLFAKELLGEKAGLLASLLLGISPWHLHLSRGFFEATIALFFFVTAIYLFVRSRKQPRLLFVSALFFILTLYTYFTPRILIPLFILFLLGWGRVWLWQRKKVVAVFLILIVTLSLPLLKLSLFDQGSNRIKNLTQLRAASIEKMVTDARNSSHDPEPIKIFLHNKATYWIREVLYSYLDHFSINFWYTQGDSSLRYFLGNMGMFYLIELPFLILGFIKLWRYKEAFWLVIGWLLLAPIPAAISGRPFAVRSLAMLPVPFLPVSVGILFVWDRIKQFRFSNIMKGVVITGFVLSLTYYLVRYHLEYPSYAATWWGWENKAAIDLALQQQTKYNQIFISNYYTGAELAFAFYTAYDPMSYRQAITNPITLADGKQFIRLGKFYFGSLDIDKKRQQENWIPAHSLYIGRPEEVKSDEVIRDPGDGRALFYIYRTE